MLASLSTALIVVFTVLAYKKEIARLREEQLSANMSLTESVEENLVKSLERIERLAASISVDKRSELFFFSAEPESFYNDFYDDLSSQLKTYQFFMRDMVDSIMLYSSEYERYMSQDIRQPYHVKRTEEDKLVNAEWISLLDKWNGSETYTQYEIRAASGTYPFVLTIIRQFVFGYGKGMVAIDIDLQKLYSTIWYQSKEDTSVWVLDETGRVIVSKNKNNLYLSKEEFTLLDNFELTGENVSFFENDGNVPVAYAQKYLEDYDLYVVSATELFEFDQIMTGRRNFYIVTGLLYIIAAMILVGAYVLYANEPLNMIMRVIKNPLEAHQYLNISAAEVHRFADYVVSNIQQHNQLKEELEKRVDLLQETQLQALKAQINPHFLFNTLNVITMMAEQELENSAVAEQIEKLSDILQYSLSAKDVATLKEELGITQKYLYIMEKRYGREVQTQFFIEPDLMDVILPKFILQPLIENAVVHGVSLKKNHNVRGRIMISARKVCYVFGAKEQSAIRIDLSDNGPGMTEQKCEELMASLTDEKIRRQHIGLQNVAKRIALLFENQGKIEIRSKQGEGTCISLIFPIFRNAERDDSNGIKNDV